VTDFLAALAAAGFVVVPKVACQAAFRLADDYWLHDGSKADAIEVEEAFRQFGRGT
jgi:hypothetical protein